jgi:ketosteroid isomerase-like protein
MSAEDHIEVVLDYFDGCNTGDLEQLRRTLDADVVHYFLPEVHVPIRGAEHLAKYWSKFQKVYDPTWRIDHIVGTGDEVISEWSCGFVLPRSGDRMMFRGTEWYVMRGALIAEVRAYYQYDETRDCELNGFPYLERGYLQK